ncbi:unnamed protein product [Nezara viridula]|uniref:Uncharacterized protein n=1 Tax=Nezara viridula TaxID=85310 RepID=A0A9P0MQ14_NEZVI|nr:unnamed protein product [Nezara viridula]
MGPRGGKPERYQMVFVERRGALEIFSYRPMQWPHPRQYHSLCQKFETARGSVGRRVKSSSRHSQHRQEVLKHSLTFQ